ncbi:hypothetical protein AMTRI_Chr13g121060 [Amborella trichopoda]
MRSIQCYGNENEKQERLFLEIWTYGSLTPKEALYEVSLNLIDFFIPFLHVEEREFNLNDDQNRFIVPFFPFHEGLKRILLTNSNYLPGPITASKGPISIHYRTF